MYRLSEAITVVRGQRELPILAAALVCLFLAPRTLFLCQENAIEYKPSNYATWTPAAITGGGFTGDGNATASSGGLGSTGGFGGGNVGGLEGLEDELKGLCANITGCASITTTTTLSPTAGLDALLGQFQAIGGSIGLSSNTTSGGNSSLLLRELSDEDFGSSVISDGTSRSLIEKPGFQINQNNDEVENIVKEEYHGNNRELSAGVISPIFQIDSILQSSLPRIKYHVLFNMTFLLGGTCVFFIILTNIITCEDQSYLDSSLATRHILMLIIAYGLGIYFVNVEIINQGILPNLKHTKVYTDISLSCSNLFHYFSGFGEYLTLIVIYYTWLLMRLKFGWENHTLVLERWRRYAEQNSNLLQIYEQIYGGQLLAYHYGAQVAIQVAHQQIADQQEQELAALMGESQKSKGGGAPNSKAEQSTSSPSSKVKEAKKEDNIKQLSPKKSPTQAATGSQEGGKTGYMFRTMEDYIESGAVDTSANENLEPEMFEFHPEGEHEHTREDHTKDDHIQLDMQRRSFKKAKIEDGSWGDRRSTPTEEILRIVVDNSSVSDVSVNAVDSCEKASSSSSSSSSGSANSNGTMVNSVSEMGVQVRGNLVKEGLHSSVKTLKEGKHKAGNKIDVSEESSLGEASLAEASHNANDPLNNTIGSETIGSSLIYNRSLGLRDKRTTEALRRTASGTDFQLDTLQGIENVNWSQSGYEWIKRQKNLLILLVLKAMFLVHFLLFFLLLLSIHYSVTFLPLFSTFLAEKLKVERADDMIIAISELIVITFYFRVMNPIFGSLIVAYQTRALRMLNVYLDRVNSYDIVRGYAMGSEDHFNHVESRNSLLKSMIHLSFTLDIIRFVVGRLLILTNVSSMLVMIVIILKDIGVQFLECIGKMKETDLVFNIKGYNPQNPRMSTSSSSSILADNTAPQFVPTDGGISSKDRSFVKFLDGTIVLGWMPVDFILPWRLDVDFRLLALENWALIASTDTYSNSIQKMETRIDEEGNNYTVIVENGEQKERFPGKTDTSVTVKICDIQLTIRNMPKAFEMYHYYVYYGQHQAPVMHKRHSLTKSGSLDSLGNSKANSGKTVKKQMTSQSSMSSTGSQEWIEIEVDEDGNEIVPEGEQPKLQPGMEVYDAEGKNPKKAESPKKANTEGQHSSPSNMKNSMSKFRDFIGRNPYETSRDNSTNKATNEKSTTDNSTTFSPFSKSFGRNGFKGGLGKFMKKSEGKYGFVPYGSREWYEGKHEVMIPEDFSSRVEDFSSRVEDFSSRVEDFSPRGFNTPSNSLSMTSRQIRSTMGSAIRSSKMSSLYAGSLLSFGSKASKHTSHMRSHMGRIINSGGSREMRTGEKLYLEHLNRVLDDTVSLSNCSLYGNEFYESDDDKICETPPPRGTSLEALFEGAHEMGYEMGYDNIIEGSHEMGDENDVEGVADGNEGKKSLERQESEFVMPPPVFKKEVFNAYDTAEVTHTKEDTNKKEADSPKKDENKNLERQESEFVMPSPVIKKDVVNAYDSVPSHINPDIINTRSGADSKNPEAQGKPVSMMGSPEAQTIGKVSIGSPATNGSAVGETQRQNTYRDYDEPPIDAFPFYCTGRVVEGQILPDTGITRTDIRLVEAVQNLVHAHIILRYSLRLSAKLLSSILIVAVYFLWHETSMSDSVNFQNARGISMYDFEYLAGKVPENIIRTGKKNEPLNPILKLSFVGGILYLLGDLLEFYYLSNQAMRKKAKAENLLFENLYRYKFLEAEGLIRILFIGMLVASLFIITLYFHTALNPFSAKNLLMHVERKVGSVGLGLLGNHDAGMKYLLGKVSMMCRES